MRKEVAKEKETLFLTGNDVSSSPPKIVEDLKPPSGTVNFLSKLPNQEDQPEDLLEKIVPDKDPLSVSLEQMKKPLSTNQFLFSLDGSLGFAERPCDPSASSQQFFLKEVGTHLSQFLCYFLSVDF